MSCLEYMRIACSSELQCSACKTHQHVVVHLQSENVAADKLWTLKLCTATQVIHLAAASEHERDQWLAALNHSINADDDAAQRAPSVGFAAGDVIDNAPCEAYVQKKRTGLFSLARAWDRRWLSAAKKDILYFKDHIATAPVDRISVQLIKCVVPSETDDLEFEIRMNDRYVV
jgi:hypothetical protein